jgi:uncharacterized membrane protein YsdA (DUF1294 family)
MMTVILYIFLALNVVTFSVYGWDKWKAIKRKWRISEATLLLLAAVGGSLGAWCGMWVWHHKTKHRKFYWGVPAIIVVQLLIIAAVWWYTR